MTKNPLKLAVFDIDGTLRRVRDPWIHQLPGAEAPRFIDGEEAPFPSLHKSPS